MFLYAFTITEGLYSELRERSHYEYDVDQSPVFEILSYIELADVSESLTKLSTYWSQLDSDVGLQAYEFFSQGRIGMLTKQIEDVRADRALEIDQPALPSSTHFPEQDTLS